jgi:hypothetical protein
VFPRGSFFRDAAPFTVALSAGGYRVLNRGRGLAAPTSLTEDTSAFFRKSADAERYSAMRISYA